MTAQREPSTASIRDVTCPSGPRASTAAAGLSEADLWNAHANPAPVMVTRPCACGGDISAQRGDWEWITVAVRSHQETALHRLWREGQE